MEGEMEDLNHKGFIRFTAKRCLSHVPMVSLANHNRVAYFNKAATELLERSAYANLFYNKETDQIAIKPCDPKDEGSMKLCARSGASWLSLASFFNYFGLKFNPKTKFKLIKQDDLFILEKIA